VQGGWVKVAGLVIQPGKKGEMGSFFKKSNKDGPGLASFFQKNIFGVAGGIGRATNARGARVQVAGLLDAGKMGLMGSIVASFLGVIF
jgi:hypothetical protein